MSNGVSRRQSQRWAEKEQSSPAYLSSTPPPGQQEQYAAPPAAPAVSGSDDMIEKLTKLGQLRDAGVLTDAEFEAQKAKVLAGL